MWSVFESSCLGFSSAAPQRYHQDSLDAAEEALARKFDDIRFNASPLSALHIPDAPLQGMEDLNAFLNEAVVNQQSPLDRPEEVLNANTFIEFVSEEYSDSAAQQDHPMFDQYMTRDLDRTLYSYLPESSSDTSDVDDL